MKKFFLVFLAVWRAKGRRHKGALERKNRRVASKVLCSFFHVVELSEWKEEKAAEVPNYIDYQSILQRGNTMASSAPFFFSLRDRREEWKWRTWSLVDSL